MKTLEATKEMYSEIMGVLNKYKFVCTFDVNELERQSKVHIYAIELKEKYGLNIDPKRVESLDYNKFGSDKTICMFGEKYSRKISWSVDGRQPEDENLFILSFPTGAYIFSDGDTDRDYPTEFFQKFWLELKTYKPDYIDEMNHCLYWRLENAKEMFNSFENVLEKYNQLNKQNITQRRIERLKAELSKLETLS